MFASDASSCEIHSALPDAPVIAWGRPAQNLFTLSRPPLRGPVSPKHAAEARGLRLTYPCVPRASLRTWYVADTQKRNTKCLSRITCTRKGPRSLAFALVFRRYINVLVKCLRFIAKSDRILSKKLQMILFSA